MNVQKIISERVSNNETGRVAVDRMTEPRSEDLLLMYEIQAKIVAADEQFRQRISSGEVSVVYYSPRGQEAISAAMGVQLRPEDYLVTTYRGLHDQIAKGIPLPDLVAEYLGRTTGTCGGKGGPMHVTHAASGVMVTTGIVGGGLPIANGFALASVLNDTTQVTVVCFGDGATNTGAFHEAVNLAAVWDLPVIFLCQNNQYGEHTAIAQSMRVATVAERAAAYGIASARVDGNDAVAMWHELGTAIDRARDGAGPTLIDALTYRFHGHILGEDLAYQPAEERNAAIAADPVPAYRSRLISQYGIDDSALSDIDRRVAAEVADAFATALAGPEPDLSALHTDVVAAVAV
jgi:acetoin:2,6-dichlorophenolindophenol oxidoreductase subunit alpha